MMSGSEEKTARGGGRAGRRARGAAAGKSAAPAFITRRIPLYNLLEPEGLAAIEDHADRILQEVGIEFRGDDECLRLFKEAGASVEGERVRFDPGHVRALCATAPRQFTHVARNPARSNVIGGEHIVLVPAYGSPFVSDLEKGRRYGTLEDFENFIKLAYMTPWIHSSGGTVCEPVDIPVNKRHLDMVFAHLRWTDKPFLGSVTAPERAADSVEMARIAFGAGFLEENCVILGNVNANSPLVFDGTMTGAIRTYAAANQGSVIVPFILGGAMGPVTAAGAIAQAHAEASVGVALTQLVRPGAPAIYGNFYSTMNLRNGAPTFGMPEGALAFMAVGQLARRLGVPLRCGGHFTASKTADAQAMQESVDAMTPAILSGANWILHAAGWLEGGLTMGYEKFLLDSERCGMLHRLFQGLTLDENAFAMEAIREAGPGHHFLGTQHTLANYETAYYDAALNDSKPFEQWLSEGSEDAQVRANHAWKKMLSEYEPPPMDAAIEEALTDFMERRKESFKDAWH
jgi:trimethylamine--corrinoid protein Co-methyltransferase